MSGRPSSAQGQHKLVPTTRSPPPRRHRKLAVSAPRSPRRHRHRRQRLHSTTVAARSAEGASVAKDKGVEPLGRSSRGGPRRSKSGSRTLPPPHRNALEGQVVRGGRGFGRSNEASPWVSMAHALAVLTGRRVNATAARVALGNTRSGASRRAHPTTSSTPCPPATQAGAHRSASAVAGGRFPGPV